MTNVIKSTHFELSKLAGVGGEGDGGRIGFFRVDNRLTDFRGFHFQMPNWRCHNDA